MKRALAALLAGVGLSIAACGAPPEPKTVPRTTEAPLHEGPLTDYVPAAGLRWMVVGSPRRLARHPSLTPAIALLLPDARLDAFAEGTGVELRNTEHALVAGFDYAMLYLVEPPNAARAEERFRARLVTEPAVARPHPRVARITGLVGKTPQTLIRVEDRLLAVAVGSATPARVVELFALEKLEKSPAALRGAALSSLPQELGRAPLRFYAPGPFAEEWTRGARGLLAAAVAVGATLQPLPNGRLEAAIFVAGDWSTTAIEATSGLLAAWEDLARSSTGRLLGLNEPLSAPRVDLKEDVLELRVELDALTLARGLRAAVEADVWEILDLAPPKADGP